MIVHGGHVTQDDEPGAGFLRWRKGLEQLETEVPVYLENTAGGDHAMARHFDTIAGLWEAIGDKDIGFCLDTCHAWAAGEALIDAVDRIKAITGRIDLVHCNDSKDAAGSGARPPRQHRHRHHRPRAARGRRGGRRCPGGVRDGPRGPQGRRGLPARPDVHLAPSSFR